MCLRNGTNTLVKHEKLDTITTKISEGTIEQEDINATHLNFFTDQYTVMHKLLQFYQTLVPK